MKNIVIYALLLSSVINLCSCTPTGNNSHSHKPVATGTILGAAGGAIIGAAVGGEKSAAKGALIGAALGGVTGFAVGHYREKQYKPADQIYRENPEFNRINSAKKPPIIKNIKPYILGPNGEATNTVKGGQTIELCMKYDIVVSRFSKIEKIEVVETNYLVDPNGVEMNKSILTRTKPRGVGGVDAGIIVTLPNNLPHGLYKHVAIIKILQREYVKKQYVRI